MYWKLFFSEWRFGLSIPAKEIRQEYVADSGNADAINDDENKSSSSPKKLMYSLEYGGKDLKFVRVAVPLRDMENENMLDSLDACLDFIEKSRKEGSVLVHCFAGVSRRYYFYTVRYRFGVDYVPPSGSGTLYGTFFKVLVKKRAREFSKRRETQPFLSCT